MPRSAQPLTATLVRTIFDQPDAASEILLVLAVWCIPAVQGSAVHLERGWTALDCN